MKKIMPLLLIIIFTSLVGIASPFQNNTHKHKHNEESYQQAWCKAHNGIMEYENKDKTRVDCLTSTHAIEFDFANKWHEGIGQALHYSLMTSKKPMVILILDEPITQMIYFKRIQKIGEKYNFDTKFVTDDVLMLDIKGKCQNPKCKCHKPIK